MNLEITGEIIEIHDTMEYGSNGFQKRRCVIREDVEQYPQEIPVDFIKDKCAVLDNFNVGDKVTAICNLRGNEFNGKRFLEVQAWKIEK